MKEWARERGRESERAEVCERMRRIDGPSDCHLAFDRRREGPSWGHVTICPPSYISVPTQTDGERRRYKEDKAVCMLTFSPDAERGRVLFFLNVKYDHHNMT